MRRVIESIEAEPVRAGSVLRDWMSALLVLALVGLASLGVLGLVYWSMMRR